MTPPTPSSLEAYAKLALEARWWRDAEHEANAKARGLEEQMREHDHRYLLARKLHESGPKSVQLGTKLVTMMNTGSGGSAHVTTVVSDLAVATHAGES